MDEDTKNKQLLADEKHEEKEKEKDETRFGVPNPDLVEDNDPWDFDDVADEEDPWDVDLNAWDERGLTLWDQVTFFVGVTNTVATALMVGGYGFILPWFYSVKLPTLVIARYFSYKSHNWHWFLLDFCYFANILMCVFLWLLPKNHYLFFVVFAIVNGPLMWAIVVFSNALVFHSVDKTTSLLIHITPILVSYVVRWSDVGDYFDVCTDLSEDNGCFPQLGDMEWPLWFILLPTAFVWAHQALYFLVVQVWCKKNIIKQKNSLTTYRYLFRHRRGPTYRCISCCGKRMRPFMFGLLFIAFGCITVIPTYFYYQSWQVHFSMIAVVLSSATWNGSVFYSRLLKRDRKGKGDLVTAKETAKVAAKTK
jgi:hypothetical protein